MSSSLFHQAIQPFLEVLSVARNQSELSTIDVSDYSRLYWHFDQVTCTDFDFTDEIIKCTQHLLHMFLVEILQSHLVGHMGKDYYSHLVGTYEFLHKWGNPPHILLAGLFHSIYGTQHYDLRPFPIAAREWIQLLIGKDAEKFSYLFCVMDRQREFFNHFYRQPDTAHIFVTDTYTGTVETISWETYNFLLEIEAANLLEQGGQAPRLFALLQAGISDAAKSYIVAYLRGHHPLDIPNPRIDPVRCGRLITITSSLVCDVDHSLPPAAMARMDVALREIPTTQVMVLVLDRIDEEYVKRRGSTFPGVLASPDSQDAFVTSKLAEFARLVHDKWGVGVAESTPPPHGVRKGVLLFLSIDYRFIYISAGVDVQHIITQREVDVLVNHMRPWLVQREFHTAIETCLQLLHEYFAHGLS